MTIADAIRFLPNDSQRLRDVARAVAASLPISSLANEGRRIAFVSGEGRWDELALEAAQSGAEAIVLDRPDYLPPAMIDDISTTLAARDVSLAVRSIWSSHAMIDDARQWFAQVAQPVLIDVAVVFDGTLTSRRAAIGAIQMVQALVGSVRSLTFDTADPSGFQARGIAGSADIPVTLVGGPSCGENRLDIRLLGTDSMVAVSAEESIDWTSIKVMRADADGEQIRPAHMESPDRSICRQLLERGRSTSGDLSDLSNFAAVAAAVSELRIAS